MQAGNQMKIEKEVSALEAELDALCAATRTERHDELDLCRARLDALKRRIKSDIKDV